jgi:murein DD-endopeptidase MepM/ murein hydrolase activator NlpD
MRASRTAPLPAVVVALAASLAVTLLSPAGAAEPRQSADAAAGDQISFGDRVLKIGREGRDVRRLQGLLTNHFGFPTETDGNFGPRTAKNVKRYEEWKRMPVDGVVDRDQAVKIKRHARRLKEGKSSYRLGERDLDVGARGDDVAKLQRLLSAMRIDTDPDGVFGGATEARVERSEKWRNEPVDGEVSQAQAHVLERRAERGAELPADEGTGSGGGGGHAFPVQGPYSYGGSGSRFGAPRSGYSHQGQDIAAASGTRIVAVHSGTVSTRQYQSCCAGNYLVIRGSDGSDSAYMHMLRPGIVAPGERVRAGQTIGYVGTTGGSSGPHLHFELWTPHWYAGGRAYDPLPKLQRWAR